MLSAPPPQPSSPSGYWSSTVPLPKVPSSVFRSSGALPIRPDRGSHCTLHRCRESPAVSRRCVLPNPSCCFSPVLIQTYLRVIGSRSEEHTSELQSRGHLVCRLLLEKKQFA